MNPEQPPSGPTGTPAQPPQHPAYDFILNPAPPPKRKLLGGVGGAGNSLQRRLFVVMGALVVLMILIVISSSLFKGSNKFTPIVTVAQEQTELARVANEGTTTATDQNALNLAYNVQMAATSAQNQLLTYLADQGVKPSTKTLSLKQSAQADTQLQNAQDDSTYDTTFVNILQQDLQAYAQALKTAYAANPGPHGRQLLSNQYDDVQLLIAQSKLPVND